ncbi:MAG: ornithine carbamoyltransferase [Anaerovoracaceae bacterium]|jgi:ornithine carbamoyltransferase|nr:ornithine carbamoyltransferase [Anaerovoracaceae bacterium]
MKYILKDKSFLTLMDFSPEEIRYLLDLSHELKRKKKQGIKGQSLKGKNVVLLFEKTSTRTRSAFEVACLDEGGNITFKDEFTSQMPCKESIEDTAKVLGRYYDAIGYRGFKQKTVEDIAKFSQIPVWNGLTDIDHPTQILADIMTIEENISKPLTQVKLVFCGDIRNNMSYAWMYGAAKMGMHYVAYGPKELVEQIDSKILESVHKLCETTKGKVEITDNPECLKGADVIYSDVWASMGEEYKIPERVRLLSPYKITMDLLKATGNDDVMFFHCLPSYHDFETTMAKTQMELGYDIREVTDEVFRSSHSKVFDEAENRMHTIKAVMVATLGSEED